MLWIIGYVIFGHFLSQIPVYEATNTISQHPHEEPSFVTESSTIFTVAGETISLPCEVAHSGSYVIAWKRGIAILTAGAVKVSPDARMSLVNGYNLQIENSVPQDAGEYVCQIATLEPIEIAHHVEILVPPVIHHVTSGGHMQVKKGSSVSLECLAYGNPEPNITWSRRNNVLPNGDEEVASNVLNVENIDRHKGGTYICTADNGVGQPATSSIMLHVLYPPEIFLERLTVHSGLDQEAMLICIVHGESTPDVTWYKNTMQLHTTERHIMERRGSRHTLLIRKVHASDFGNYTCMAENPLGKAKKTITLTGIPKTAIFHSPPISQWGDRYNISWAVDSHSPVEEFKLFFRRLPKDHHHHHHNIHNKNVDYSGSGAISSEHLRGSQQHSLLQQHQQQKHREGNKSHQQQQPHYDSYWYKNGHGSIVHWTGNEWRDVILPAIPLSYHYTQPMSYLIHGLEPDRRYEAKVQARNRYGWSEVSERFIFATPNSNSEVRDMRSTQFSGMSRLCTNYSIFKICIYVMLIAFVICI